MTISFLAIYDYISRLQSLTTATENALTDGYTFNAADLLSVIHDDLKSLERCVEGLEEQTRLKAIAAAETEV